LALSVLIACDHGLVRHALSSLLRRQSGVEVAAECAVTSQLADLARTRSAQVVLMAVDSAETAVSPRVRALYRDLGEIPVVLLNLTDDDERLLDALAMGVRGIIDKNADGARLIETLREVLNGEITISKRLASRLVLEYMTAQGGERPRKPQRPSGRSSELSERELEVLSRLARGESNRKIAERMYISVHTVRAHVRSLMSKLHVQNRVQAATYALRHGLVAPPGPEAAAGEAVAGRRT
jgi:DNA-binding NarL/FixJ family response regulator